MCSRPPAKPAGSPIGRPELSGGATYFMLLPFLAAVLCRDTVGAHVSALVRVEENRLWRGAPSDTAPSASTVLTLSQTCRGFPPRQATAQCEYLLEAQGKGASWTAKNPMGGSPKPTCALFATIPTCPVRPLPRIPPAPSHARMGAPQRPAACEASRLGRWVTLTRARMRAGSGCAHHPPKNRLSEAPPPPPPPAAPRTPRGVERAPTGAVPSN